MKKYKCIIFDMDGTLTQTNQLIFESFNYIAEKYINKRLTPDEIIELFGPPEEECIENLIGSQYIEPAMNDYYRFYRAEHGRLAALYPGTKEILEFLKKRDVLLCLFTGKGRTTTDITLEEVGIGQYFDMTITGDDVDEFKPSGDGIRKIMQKFSLQSVDVLMVGDSVSDFSASRETGVDIASVVWDSYGKDDVLKLPSDYHFHDVNEFFVWLKTIYH
ncbi:MAG: HAD family hydrolase [Ignavibacteriales bacterium]|nr:HAD family hydrolase [Ignavibacteriales bacterium]